MRMSSVLSDNILSVDLKKVQFCNYFSSSNSQKTKSWGVLITVSMLSACLHKVIQVPH